MAMMPKRMKFRKSQRGRIRGVAHRGNTVSFGEYGLQALDEGWMTARQIEAGRMAATHFLRREGRVYIRVFPHKPVSSKPLETRMGKGKGEPEYYVAVVKKGTVLYEIGGVTEEAARLAFTRVAHKMPFRCRFITRRHAVS
jgi:large subunit ribosomal protein L16